MKITYLMRFWPTFGGGETVTRALVNEFAKRGHEVSVIYLWDRTNNIQDYVDKNVKTYRLDGITNVADGGIKKIEYAHISQKLKIVFDNIHPEIVVNQWLPTKEVALALKGREAKLIKCHHGSVRWEPTELVTMKQKIFYGILGERGKYIRVFPEYLKDYLYSDKWVLLCDGFLKQAKRILPFADDKKLAVIPNPLPYYVGPDEIDIKGKSREILYVGRIVFLKKLPYIIEAWSKIEDQADGWSFRIVGDGDCLSDVKTFASKTNCKRIIFEGYKDSRPFFKNAPIMVMASSSEGFGMVLVEGQQSGCVPIVVDSFDAVHDIIENGMNGILVENYNINKFADAILELINDKERREKLALAGMKTCRKFDIARICDKWEELFSELKISRKGAR